MKFHCGDPPDDNPVDPGDNSNLKQSKTFEITVLILVLIIVLVLMLLVSVMARYSFNPGADHDADDCHCKDEDVMEQSKEATGV